jgi:hypothetical protein
MCEFVGQRRIAFGGDVEGAVDQLGVGRKEI